MSRKRAEWAVLAALLLALAVLLLVSFKTHAASGMFGVGQMMGPSGDASSTPGGGFAITTENDSPLTTENSSVLVTENAP